MADKTKIEWTDATWNPITGCAVVSPGCTHCYAMKLAGTRLANHDSRIGLTRDTKAGPVWTGEVRFNEQWLAQPLRWSKPRRIFVCAHGDLFAEGVQDEWLDKIFAVMALAKQHTFQVLTKRPERMHAYVQQMQKALYTESAEFANRWGVAAATAANSPCAAGAVEDIDWPLPNVWLGVSVEDQTRAEQRIPVLLQTPAAIRWISAEPLLGPLDLTTIDVSSDGCVDALNIRTWEEEIENWRGTEDDWEESFLDWYNLSEMPEGDMLPRLDWVVVGGESGKDARPMHPDWAISLRNQCAKAKVPFLFKQWGSCLPGDMSGESERGGPAWLLEDEHCGVDYDTLGLGSEITAHGRDFIRFKHSRTGRQLDGRIHDEFPEVRS